jgi:aspartate ammonia-lyase
LEQELNKKTKQYSNLVKVGRTHLQDAVPITFGQEFDAYKEALTKSKKFIIQQSKELKILGIGGTALGTGINTDPQYRPLIIKKLSEIIKIKFKSANNLTESANNMNSFMNFSAALRSLATNLLNLSEDLKLMNMGPKAGLGEIDLPAVQPGSSIMPGKINPSIPECIDMVSMQVAGNDKVIELAAQKSHFELNVYCPIIMHNILQSMTILTNGTKTIREKAIKNLRINEKKVQEDFDNSLVLATTLAPYIGYPKTAEIVKESLKKGTSLKEEILNKKLYNKKELSELLSVKKTTQPTKIDKRFIKKAS